MDACRSCLACMHNVHLWIVELQKYHFHLAHFNAVSSVLLQPALAVESLLNLHSWISMWSGGQPETNTPCFIPLWRPGDQNQLTWHHLMRRKQLVSSPFPGAGDFIEPGRGKQRSVVGLPSEASTKALERLLPSPWAVWVWLYSKELCHMQKAGYWGGVWNDSHGSVLAQHSFPRNLLNPLWAGTRQSLFGKDGCLHLWHVNYNY